MTRNTGGAQPVTGELVRQGEQELAASGETAAAAVAAQAEAAVKARYALAVKRPRDWSVVRSRLLEACKRPGFAADAIYHKPIGEGIEGPSIRFAEEALRCMTNVMPEATVVFDDAERRIVRISVTDLENNLTYSKDVVIEKFVERSKLRDGQEALRVRTNAAGRRTYLVAPTDDELLAKQNSAESRATREAALRLLPSDILEEAIATAYATRSGAQQQQQKGGAPTPKEPAHPYQNLLDSFQRLSVTRSDLENYLGHSFDKISKAERSELFGIGVAIKEGGMTWSAALAAKIEKRAASPAPALAPTSSPGAGPAPAAGDPSPPATGPAAGPASAEDDIPRDFGAGAIAPELEREPGADDGPDEIVSVAQSLGKKADAATTLAELDELKAQIEALPAGLGKQNALRSYGLRRTVLLDGSVP